VGDESFLALLRASAAIDAQASAIAQRALIVTAEVIVRRTLRRWVDGVLLRRGLMDDVVQEALLRLWINRSRCRAQSDAEAVGWVTAIARCTAADVLRPEWRLPTISVEIENALHTPASTEDDDMGLAGRVAWLSWTLREQDSAILWHRLVLNQAWCDVGASLGISWTAARRRYQRAIVRLRALAVLDPEVRRMFAGSMKAWPDAQAD
jgi:DNA-directed RNA polymerase specialized sigma24 family protein